MALEWNDAGTTSTKIMRKLRKKEAKIEKIEEEVQEKAKMKIDMKLCSGCRVCEMVCDLKHNSETGTLNPKRAHIRISGQFPKPYKIKFSGCTHCGECAKFCPTGAISLKDGQKSAENSALNPVPCKKNEIGGYAGEILFIDLSRKIMRKWRSKRLTKELIEKYLGGRGLAAYLLYKHNPKGVDPLSPKNNLIVASGPLAGTFVPAGGKITFASKSPLTGGNGHSSMGGHLAAELKYAGYDALVIKGKMKKPSILVIDDGKIEIRGAGKYWGMYSIDAEKALKEDLGENFQIAVIGPAGENLVRFACVSHDFGRQAGRTGMGAVMGSKNLKAICVKGTKGIPIHDIEAMIKKGKEMFTDCLTSDNQKHWTRYGTPGVTDWVNEIGAFPVRNFKGEYFVHHKNLNGETMREKIVTGDKGCFGCPMPCGKVSHAVKNGAYDIYVEGPEYETIALCGGNCEISSIEDVAYVNYLLDQYGIDTISGGAVMAFAIECFQKNLISLAMTCGRKLNFGDIETMEFLVKEIGEQKSELGRILSLGTKKAAQILGGNSMDFAIQVKGLEQSGYGIRDAPAMALADMTSSVGAHHSDAWAITRDIEKGRKLLEGKAEWDIYLQHVRPLFDMFGTCRLQWVELPNFPLEYYPEIFKCVTGLDFTLEELLEKSERIFNLTRCFWKRENPDFGRLDDQPPARFLKEEVPLGPTCGAKLTQGKVDYLLDDYYKLRGWDQNGIPTKEKLEALGLDFVVEDLFPENKKKTQRLSLCKL